VSGNKPTSLPRGGRLLVWQPILPVFLCCMSPLRLITVWLLALPFLFITHTHDFSGFLRDSANELQLDTSGCRLVISIQVRVKSANRTIDDRTQPPKDQTRSSSSSTSNSSSLRAFFDFSSCICTRALWHFLDERVATLYLPPHKHQSRAPQRNGRCHKQVGTQGLV
jgi:hypothetical protein